MTDVGSGLAGDREKVLEEPGGVGHGTDLRAGVSNRVRECPVLASSPREWMTREARARCRRCLLGSGLVAQRAIRWCSRRTSR